MQTLTRFSNTQQETIKQRLIYWNTRILYGVDSYLAEFFRGKTIWFPD